MKKIINFSRDRNKGNPESERNKRIDEALAAFQKDRKSGNITDIVIAWRTDVVHNNEEHRLLDYIWWNKDDRYATVGILFFLMNQVTKYLEQTNETIEIDPT